MFLHELIATYSSTLKQYAHKTVEINAENVFQSGNEKIQDIIESALLQFAKPDSRILESKNLLELCEKTKQGKKCLILPEHYSNFDYPFIIKLLKMLGKEGEEMASRCIAMAGVKLSEKSDAISMLTDAYNRIYVYPTRSLKNIEDPQVLATELKKARSINLASMRMMEKLREEGHIIVVFPTGTRYRPGVPETKRAIREIDSYIKTSDYMVLLSINGNCLRVSETEDMTNDMLVEDTILLEASPIIDCAEFRKDIASRLKDGEDKKQKLADELMYRLDAMHKKNEKSGAYETFI